MQLFTLCVLIFTLCVLIWQTRQFALSNQATVYGQIVDQNVTLNSLILAQKDDVRNEVQEESVPEMDDRVVLIADTILDHFENVFIQNQINNLPKRVWPGWERYMARRVQNVKAIKRALDDDREIRDPAFLAYVDGTSPREASAGSRQKELLGMPIRDIIIAGAFIVVTGFLVFLTVQTLELIRSSRAIAYNQIVGKDLHLNSLVLSIPASAQEQFRDAAAAAEPNVEIDLIAETILAHWENVYVQHRINDFSESAWPGWKSYMAAQIRALAPLKQAWERVKGEMDKGFRAYVDGK